MDENLKAQIQAALDAGDMAALRKLIGPHTNDESPPDISGDNLPKPH